MSVLFNAKYISIKWKDKDTVLAIDEALYANDIEVIDDYTYALEVQTYTRLENGGDGQIAFNVFDEMLDITPFFEDAMGNKVPLLKIVDPKSLKSWWIEKGEWLKSYKCRSSPLWNRPGDAKIFFGDIVCNITVRANSFTRQEFDLYLNDFKNDFWYLILQEDSLITGEAKSKKVKILNNNSSELISKFIEFMEKILTNPKVELKEVQTLKDIKKIRPVPRTFMEIARHGIKKKLTSRDYIPSYNIAENQYIYYILHKVYYLVSRMHKASLHMGEFYSKNDTYTKQRLSSFTDYKTIDKEVYENDISEFQERLEEEKELFANIISNQDPALKELIPKQIDYLYYVQNLLNKQNKIDTSGLKKWDQVYIKLNKQQDDYGDRMQFWATIQDSTTGEWQELGFNESISLQFDRNIFHTIFSEGQEFIIDGYSHSSTISTTNGGVIYKELFTYVSALRPMHYPKSIVEKTLHIKINGKRLFQNIISFKGTAKDFNGQWFKFHNPNDFYSFEFDGKFGSILSDYQEYIITGYIYNNERKWDKNGKKGTVFVRHFKYIKNIQQITISPIEVALNKLMSNKPELERNNWKIKLNPSEQKEQEFERKALNESLKNLNEEQKGNLELVEKLAKQIKQLKLLKEKYKALKIKKNSYFPNSMTFVQNPNYQGSHRYYKKILDIVGIDENLFIQLQLLDKIGLLDITKIYERWCFLQVIKVIINKYHFIPEDNWKVKLAQQIFIDKNNIKNISKIKNISIRFSNDDVGRKITLWYQLHMKVPNHKTKKEPDIVLDVDSVTGNHKLIMDPKFHEIVDIEKQIEELYHNRNYAASDTNKPGPNTVFVLHPDTKKSVHIKKTPKPWAHDAYYGEVDMFRFKWDQYNHNIIMPNHRYGAILLSPVSRNGNYLDNLQRLIGMFLQYNCEVNDKIIDDDEKINPIATEKIFCIVCGGKDHKEQKTLLKSGYGYSYTYTCLTCKHTTQYNYCWNCRHRLIKNGEYWSYHSAEVLEPFNIKCPHCSKLLRKR